MVGFVSLPIPAGGRDCCWLLGLQPGRPPPPPGSSVSPPAAAALQRRPGRAGWGAARAAPGLEAARGGGGRGGAGRERAGAGGGHASSCGGCRTAGAIAVPSAAPSPLRSGWPARGRSPWLRAPGVGCGGCGPAGIYSSATAAVAATPPASLAALPSEAAGAAEGCARPRRPPADAPSPPAPSGEYAGPGRPTAAEPSGPGYPPPAAPRPGPRRRKRPRTPARTPRAPLLLPPRAGQAERQGQVSGTGTNASALVAKGRGASAAGGSCEGPQTPGLRGGKGRRQNRPWTSLASVIPRIGDDQSPSCCPLIKLTGCRSRVFSLKKQNNKLEGLGVY